ncbi:MAG: adenylyl-sulfate kinase [Oscillospiraceae bacterium]|nr:adenylyl-sulfate kinase [Oscillospiraceae bacterium]
MNIELQEINEKLLTDSSAFVIETDNAYQSRLHEIADDIALHREERPIILLSGPSGSGKTTTAQMIEKILDERGIETHTLSLDNYFSPFSPEERELYDAGKLDLESPKRVDSAFLTEQLNAIEEGRPVELPIYDFKESARVMSGQILQRKPGELVILEGIHSLNPDVIRIPDETTAKIYVSVRTRITANGETLHPSKIRLMRRMVRDRLFRKRTLSDTLMMFRSVEEGENKYIMPYKYRSTYDVDTFMAYEICAYRDFLLEDLRSMSDEPELNDASAFLADAKALSLDVLPDTSLIREFVGH